MTSRVLSLADAVGSESWGTKVRRRARQLAKSIDQGYVELAEIIYTIWNTPINGDPKQACICVSWGYQTYTQWAAEELGLARRKTERLKGIWEHLEVTLEGKLSSRTRKRFLALGIGKVRELVRVVTVKNAEEWIEMAEHLSYQELCVAIIKALEKQEKYEQAKAVGAEDDENDAWAGADPPDDTERFKGWTFMLSPEQRENVKMAIERARQLAAESGMSKPDKLANAHYLDLICTDFLSTNDFRLEDDPEMVLRYLAKFERLLHKRLVVIDPENWRIEYGIDALQKVAEMEENNG